ncbi:MAG: hypothetical protein HY782_06720 [Chloroflexi bacterium]|nr:hypothetical protein [Chloroflexota bacterium]
MPAIVVNIDPPKIQVEPGAKATATITVRNRSEEVAHYLLQVEGLTPDWAEIVPNQVSAFPLQETRAQLTIHPPNGTRGATYHMTVRAISQGDSGGEGRGLIDVDVPAPAAPPIPVASEERTERPEPPPIAARPLSAAQIEIKAEPLKETKLPPPAAQWKLSLRNASTVLDTFSFNISGVRPNWVNIDPAALTLKPGEEGHALLTVRPGPETPGGGYPFKLRSFSHLNLNQRTELALQIQVTQSTAFELHLSPREAEAQGLREFKVSLSSSPATNTDLWLNLVASDQDNACDYTFEPSEVYLPAKQNVTSTLRVAPHAVLGPNERKTYTFRVTATPRDLLAPPQSDEARLTQIGATPVSLGLRPQIQSSEMSADYTVMVINPSTVQTMLFLSGEDPADSCDYIFQPSKIMLPPRGQVQVMLRVRPRVGLQGETSQQIPFTISATRTGELMPAARAEGKLMQQPLRPIGLAIIPPQQSRPGRARYFVKIKNPHAAPVHIWLDAKDEQDAVAFAFRPTEIHLSTGAEGTATLMATPRDKLPVGEPRRVHKFTVTCNVDGAKTTVTTNGTLAQTRGTDYPRFVTLGFKWGGWALKWLVAFVVVLFLTTFLLAGLDRVAERSPELGRLVYSIVSPNLLRGVLGLSPFTGAAQRIVFLVEGIMNMLGARR